MSYSLEDILNAINQQPQPQQQRLHQQRSYRQAPQYRFYPSGNYRGYPFATGLDDEDDDEDDYYQSRYPDYYPPFFSPYAQRRQYRRAPGAYQPEPVPEQEEQEQKDSHGSFPSGANGLFELLNQLAGQNLPDQSADQEAPDTSEERQPSNPEESEITQKQDAQTEASKAEEPTKEQASPLQATQPTVSKLARRHSAASFKEPKPKIEISQRNFKNPSIPYSPQTNIYESKENYDIVLAIPGASIKNLDIDFHPSSNELVIKGNIPEITDILGNSSSERISKVGEIRTGSIERRVKFPNLPKIIDEEIKAKYVNGLLSIRIPKNLESETQKIKRKVTIEDVPDEELLYEAKGGLV